MEEEKRMKELLNEGVKVFDWARWISVGIGVWPLAPNNYIFNITFFYSTIFMIFEYIDIFFHIHDIAAIMDNLSENVPFTVVYVYTLFLRIERKELSLIFNELLSDYTRDDAFENLNEVKTFKIYSDNAKFFVKNIIGSAVASGIIWFLYPMTKFNNLDFENKTSIILPYRAYIFHEINDLRIYALTYACESPFAAVIYFGITSFNVYLIIIVFHLSGRLAILAIRIDKFQIEKMEYRDKLNVIVENIKLIKLGHQIADIFSTPLLVFFVLINFSLCVLGYQILVILITGLNAEIMQYIILLCTAYVLLFVICFNSELLSDEKNKVYQAFCNCSWYNMPPSYIKDITFCLAHLQNPLVLKAGKFSTFSYVTMTSITKTAFGYFSVLKNFLVRN
ncbi:odorant receptor 85b-like [Microplitis mediator]|uniref:odorant receptor 85b-like n=1 Tax=Microplitis mediator TaxID=375433 RepID=UPI002554E896|nr:odorant receptor 85b-like [Microplitis mediator]